MSWSFEAPAEICLSGNGFLGHGVHAGTLHYTANNATFASGFEGLLLVDAGCEVLGYASDITRTLPIGNGGRFTKEAREIYEIVLEMQDVRWFCNHWSILSILMSNVLIITRFDFQPKGGHQDHQDRCGLEGYPNPDVKPSLASCIPCAPLVFHHWEIDICRAGLHLFSLTLSIGTKSPQKAYLN